VIVLLLDFGERKHLFPEIIDADEVAQSWWLMYWDLAQRTHPPTPAGKAISIRPPSSRHRQLRYEVL
jgi:hypothetical protein